MEIKKAYRRLAMQFHPDKSDDPRAAAAFILVNEAYEYLRDTSRRALATRSGAKSKATGRQRDEDMRKDRHDDWERYQREAARQRAYRNAESSAEEFAKSPIYKAAMVIDKVFNYLFVAVGLLIILVPILNLEELRDYRTGELDRYGIVMPFIIGASFIYGIWYFIFRLPAEKS